MTKTLFTIGQLARQFGCTHRALRFWEDKGLIAPTRMGFRRLYSTEDRERVCFIVQTRALDLSLPVIAELLALHGSQRRRALARALAERGAALETQLDKVKAAIDALAESKRSIQ